MNHPYPPRGMVPQGAPSQRLNELLESIRGEFETESQRSVDYESQSECSSAYLRWAFGALSKSISLRSGRKHHSRHVRFSCRGTLHERSVLSLVARDYDSDICASLA
jgi:hypothetical protein